MNEVDVDKINAEQIEKAREAGREYQGKEPDAPAEPKKSPEPTKAEQPAPESGSVARDTLEAESHKK